MGQSYKIIKRWERDGGNHAPQKKTASETYQVKTWGQITPAPPASQGNELMFVH